MVTGGNADAMRSIKSSNSSGINRFAIGSTPKVHQRMMIVVQLCTDTRCTKTSSKSFENLS